MLTFAGLAKNEFQLVLWVSSSLILLAQGHFLPFLVNDFVRGSLSWTLSYWTSKL